ncbi:MAG TPA: hypothetical protein VHD32_01050 [Candidatus Didemnitutus sp.]|nr:hypothetical protein [Candidatus Didemnitutus sp.]
MKHPLLSLIAVACLLLGFASSSAFAAPEGPTVKVKGEVVDLWCYLEGGDHGADHRDCAVACAKAGNPVGLLTDKGEIYVMMGIKDHQPGREVLIDKMAETVTVEGTLVKKGGVQVIYVTAVK